MKPQEENAEATANVDRLVAFGSRVIAIGSFGNV
jgi:hypothetical protein